MIRPTVVVRIATLPQDLEHMLEIDCQEITRKIVEFLKDEVYKAGFKKVIVSTSGGVDSSTVALLAVKALGPRNVLIARFPYQDLNKDNDAKLVISALEIPKENVFEIEISGMVKPFLLRFHLDKGGTLEKIRLGNIMARVRMILLYDLAKREKALVCGTENKSEDLLGYFTRFGDEASDLEPIRNLYKTQVIALAKYLGVPQRIIVKPPSAGLWKRQTDEEELGFSYKIADKILYLHFDKRHPWEEIERIGFKKETVDKVRLQVEKNEFKHKVPKTVKPWT